MNEATTDDMLATHTSSCWPSPCCWGPSPQRLSHTPVSWHGAGHVTFTGGNPPTGGNLTASGTATHLGQGTAIRVLSFSPGPWPQLILASGQQTFTAANGVERHVEFKDAVLGTTMGIATGVFLFLGGKGSSRRQAAALISW